MKRILKYLWKEISAFILQPSLKDCANVEYHKMYLDSLARRNTLPRFPRNHSLSIRQHVPYGRELLKSVPLNHPRIRGTYNFLLWCEDEPD